MGSSPKTFDRCAPLGARHRGGGNHYAIAAVRFPRIAERRFGHDGRVAPCDAPEHVARRLDDQGRAAAVGELDEIPVGVADPD